MAEYLKEDFMEKQPRKESELFPEIAEKPKENAEFLRFKGFRKSLELSREAKKAASKPKRAEPLEK